MNRDNIHILSLIQIQKIILFKYNFTENTSMNIICKEYSLIYFDIQIFATLWSNIVQNGTKIGKIWSKMVKDGSKWSKTVQHYPIWSKVI